MADFELCPMTPDHIRIREVLINFASRKKTISYTELLKLSKVKLDMSIPFDRGVLGHLLGEISWNEVAECRPMLSSVAIHAGDYKQGQGFFDLAERLYGITFKNADQKLMFGMKELNKTHEYWITNNKVKS
jgi:hypothetical protein